jgi:hypothetical protein
MHLPIVRQPWRRFDQIAMLDEPPGMRVTFDTVTRDQGNVAFRLLAEPVIGVTGNGPHTAVQRLRIGFVNQVGKASKFDSTIS